MLISLTIRDIILIERLELEFERGLCALTGETGAGKSILLDALGLALGGRAERTLVRAGAAQGSVNAAFALPGGPELSALLDSHGLVVEETLLLRRVVGADGRSRAFVNDQPVSTGLLRELAALLVEVHGQHEQQALLDPGVQRRLLDAYGRLDGTLAGVRRAHAAWREAERERAALEVEVARAATDEAYWRHALDELDQLAPAPGEESALAEARARLMNREKLIQAIGEALRLVRGPGGAEERLGSAQRTIERALALAGGMLEAPAPGSSARGSSSRRPPRPWSAPASSWSSMRAGRNRSKSGCSRCAPRRASIRSRSTICRACATRWPHGSAASTPARSG